jgi:hypothetical protein
VAAIAFQRDPRRSQVNDKFTNLSLHGWVITASECRMSNEYLDVISLIERLHRQFLEVVKLELDGMGIRDINNGTPYRGYAP